MSHRLDGAVRVTGGFVLLSAWFALENGTAALALTLLAAAAHECGHLAALRLCGCGVRRVQIGILGAEMETERSRLRYGAELFCLLAGPGVNLLLAALLTLPARTRPGWYAAVGANLTLGAFNLLPIRPLDGGAALELLTAWRFGPAAGERAARACGALCAAALSAGLLRLIWASGGNLWLLPAAGGLAAACLKELSGWPGPRQGRRLRHSL